MRLRLALASLALLSLAGPASALDLSQIDPSNPKDLAALRAAAEAGDARAEMRLYEFFRFGALAPSDPSEPVKWLRKAAEQGEPEAEFELGAVYDRGDLGPRDQDEAMKWFRKAAEHGQANVGAYVGRALVKGENGWPRDRKEAARWYRFSTDKDDHIADFELALLYIDGKDVGRNYREAERLLQRAAELGSEAAPLELAIVAGKGDNPNADIVEVYMWFEVAALQKNPHAPLFAAQTGRQMTPAQIAVAEGRARNWIAAHPLKRSD